MKGRVGSFNKKKTPSSEFPHLVSGKPQVIFISSHLLAYSWPSLPHTGLLAPFSASQSVGHRVRYSLFRQKGAGT